MSLTQDQLQFEHEWVKRWIAGTRTLNPDQWVDPFYHDNAKVIRAHQPSLEGIAAIRTGVTQMCQLFNAFEADDVSITVDEKEGRIIVLCEMTMVLKPDPEQKRLSTSAAIIIKKPLGVNEEKMTEEQAILDSAILMHRLGELGIDPRKLAEH